MMKKSLVFTPLCAVLLSGCVIDLVGSDSYNPGTQTVVDSSVVGTPTTDFPANDSVFNKTDLVFDITDTISQKSLSEIDQLYTVKLATSSAQSNAAKKALQQDYMSTQCPQGGVVYSVADPVGTGEYLSYGTLGSSTRVELQNYELKFYCK